MREDFPDAARIGFLGVSQGGMIAPTAAKLFGADFAVGVSVTATSLNEQLLHEVGNDVRAAGAPNLLIPAIRAIYTQRAKNRYGEFWRKNGSFDTLSEWSKWGGPFFIILGADDERQFNPVEKSVARLAATDTKGGRLIWRVYQGVNHSLTYGPGPDEDRFHRDFVRDLFDWLDNYEIVGETR